jgi:hypothetical protein
MKQDTPIRKRRYRKSETPQNIMPNPEGGKGLFWVVYIGGMIVYILHIMNK